MYGIVFVFSKEESFYLKMGPKKKVKLSLREVMDEINSFLDDKGLDDPEIEADDIGELYNKSGKTQLT